MNTFGRQKVDRLTPTIFNVGYLGFGDFVVTQENKKIYSVWRNMLERGYSEKYKLKNPTYLNVTVDERWHNFQVFAEWCKHNYIDGFHLDKDILFKGNKIYSPETCCFVPTQINSLFLKSNGNKFSNLPIGIRPNGSNFCVKMNKFGKYVLLGTYPTIERAFNVYKTNKEFYILQVANFWKPKIPNHVYVALINYKIEITD